MAEPSQRPAARSWPLRTLDARLTEVEERLEGVEYLLADLRQHLEMHPLTAPEAARMIEEERYRAFPQTNNERSSS